ncbi:MAG TPA: hypothetical protein VFS19_03050 [Planctomycetota bacterium]|nr:hypothetical protein [Planctomycetota bacterium]
MGHLDELAQDRVRAGEASPDEAQHAKDCMQCMVEVEVLRFMANAMKDAQAVAVPAEVDRAILSSIPKPRRRPVWALFAGSAAAAVLAVAITLTFVAPAHADVVDAYSLAVKGGNPNEILSRCTRIRSPRKIETAGNRFVAVDVYVEAGDRKLAAWQVEIGTDDRAAIVGVEGGEPAVYRDPPTYDPAAVQGGRIILAALTTGDAPSGRVRVARLHLMESARVDLEGKVLAAGAPGGARFDAKVTLVRMGDAR